MTQQEILEYNKRCAEFLGLKRGWWVHQENPLTEDKRQWCDLGSKTFLGAKVYYDNDLKFHSDWNWIMEVVEAIQKISVVNIYKNECSIAKEVNVSFFKGYGKTKEAVVQAINQFLIWYENDKTSII